MAQSIDVLLLGAGSMGRALAQGIANKKGAGPAINLSIYDVHEERSRQLAQECGGEVLNNLNARPKEPDAIVLCIKPHDLAKLGSTEGSKFSTKSLIISFLAGTEISDLAEKLNFKGAIVRAMPNIAAKVGLGATGATANAACTEQHKEIATSLLTAVGNLHWLKEELMDAVTGLSGSGPAYVFMVIEAMTDGGVKMGIPRDIAASLAVQTVAGAAALIQETGQHPAILKDQVTTPGGTTINGLYKLEAHGLRPMFIEAIATATRRSKDLRRPPEKREMD